MTDNLALEIMNRTHYLKMTTAATPADKKDKDPINGFITSVYASLKYVF
jgi:hypothetical protein